MKDKPYLCLTGDLDWCSEAVLKGYLKQVTQFDVTPTLFATHSSDVLSGAENNNQVEVGVHPNFFDDSTQGESPDEIIEHLEQIYPEAKSYRTHSFYDHSRLKLKMKERGFEYDSNLCLHLQEGLVPLRHASGIVQFPVFWEDDIHWMNHPGEWEVENLLEKIMTPGLKILNVHPINVALNVPGIEFYRGLEKEPANWDQKEIDNRRFDGRGTRTFLIELLDELIERNVDFYTLGELYESTDFERFRGRRFL